MLKVGVFGVGHLGKFHINNWKEIEGIKLVGFFDPNNDNAKEAVEKYGLKRFVDEDKLMDACDIIDVIAPTDHHFQICMQAIRKGKHVFVEKPLAHTIQEGRDLVNMVREANVKMQVGHVERFNPAYLAIQEMNLNPMFIEAHRLSAFQPRGTDVSVVLDLMIHDLDLILHLVKSPVKKVSAGGVAVMSKTPDIANARIEFENGCIANLTASRISLKQMRKMRLFQLHLDDNSS